MAVQGYERQPKRKESFFTGSGYNNPSNGGFAPGLGFCPLIITHIDLTLCFTKPMVTSQYFNDSSTVPV